MNAEYKNRYIQFGLNVVYYRKKNRLSQSMLAERSEERRVGKECRL